MGLDELRATFPWPTERPTVPTNAHGWFQDENKLMLAARITPATRLIVELGSWLGLSTRWLLDNSPQEATVIAVDHWEGSSEHKTEPQWQGYLPTLFETFLANQWNYKDRLIPVRTTTTLGLGHIANAGLSPDLIYVDASHETDLVLHDIVMAVTLFPDAAIVGDDWSAWPSVRAAVELFAREHCYDIEVDRNAWAVTKNE
jgi:hypothetical protein